MVKTPDQIVNDRLRQYESNPTLIPPSKEIWMSKEDYQSLSAGTKTKATELGINLVWFNYIDVEYAAIFER